MGSQRVKTQCGEFQAIALGDKCKGYIGITQGSKRELHLGRAVRSRINGALQRTNRLRVVVQRALVQKHSSAVVGRPPERTCVRTVSETHGGPNVQGEGACFRSKRLGTSLQRRLPHKSLEEQELEVSVKNAEHVLKLEENSWESQADEFSKVALKKARDDEAWTDFKCISSTLPRSEGGA